MKSIFFSHDPKRASCLDLKSRVGYIGQKVCQVFQSQARKLKLLRIHQSFSIMPFGIMDVEQDKISSCRTLKRKEDDMTIIVVADWHGWGKGNTWAEAVENYRKNNGSLRKGQKYENYEITANSIDDVWGDSEQMSIRGKNGATIVKKELRTF